MKLKNTHFDGYCVKSFLLVAQFSVCIALSPLSPKSCYIAPTPLFGSWKALNFNDTFNSSWMPTYTILEVKCIKGYKLEGCKMVVCMNGRWTPNLGRCLRTCPSLSSTPTTTVTCTFKGQQRRNCIKPFVGTVANFKCESFYETSKSRAVCIDGKWSENVVPDCTAVCGRASFKKAPTLIVQGKKAKKGKFPWQIAIYRSSDRFLICGGTLLSERVVLTAAHCITTNEGLLLPSYDYFIAAGKFYRKFNHSNDEEKYVQISEIQDMFVPDIYEGDGQNYLGDIAVIITLNLIRFSSRVQPVCIDWNKNYQHIAVNSGHRKGYVSGWGNTKENSKVSAELRFLRVPSIPRKNCKKVLPEEYQNFVTFDKFCAGYEDSGKSVCGGDSGGGLVFGNNGKFYIAGVVSLAPLSETASGGCNSQQYALYTLVYNYTDDFILDKLARFKGPATYTNRPQVITSPFPPSFLFKQVSTLPPGACLLPPFPTNGEFILAVEKIFAFRSQLYSTETVLKLTCFEQHKLFGQDFITCRQGSWRGHFGKCIIMCPPLEYTPEISITCSYKDPLSGKYVTAENCDEPIDGTIARYQCNTFYNSIEEEPLVCLGGLWSKSLPQCVPECGLKTNIDSNLKKLSPWHVSIYKNQGTNKTLTCGSTLISPGIVITGAQCVTNSNGTLSSVKDLVVVAGNQYSGFMDDRDLDSVQISKPKILVLSEDYKGEQHGHHGDVALIILEKPFILSSTVLPICLDFKLQSISRAEITITDKNFLNSSRSSLHIFKSTTIDFISKEDCEDVLHEEFELKEMHDKQCANILNNDSFLCMEDNGGGVVAKHKDRYHLVGVLSLVSKDEENGCVHRNFLHTKIGSYDVNYFIEANIFRYGAKFNNV